MDSDEEQRPSSPDEASLFDDERSLLSDHEQAPRMAWQEGQRKSLETQLYVSHSLSAWNSRLFEFGAVLFLASIFPNTLLPMSVYALTRSASAIVSSQPVGAWIDSGNRLNIVRTSIILQRLPVAASCGILWLMEKKVHDLQDAQVYGLLAVLCVLAGVEKVSAMANTIAVERDWVVVMTDDDDDWRRSKSCFFVLVTLLALLLIRCSN